MRHGDGGQCEAGGGEHGEMGPKTRILIPVMMIIISARKAVHSTVQRVRSSLTINEGIYNQVRITDVCFYELVAVASHTVHLHTGPSASTLHIQHPCPWALDRLDET